MQIIYKEKAYSGVLQFNGSILKLTVYDSNQDAFLFSVDSLTCCVSFKELEKVYQTEKTPDSFLPVAVYGFLNQLGSVVQTEIHDEKTGIYYISRNVNTQTVVLEVTEAEADEKSYVIKIN